MQGHHPHDSSDAIIPEYQRPSLATGFRDVDRSGDVAAYARCLDLLSGLPFFCDIKAESFRIITRSHATRVLDAGCGAGSDLISLASLLHRQCRIAGLDASGSLLSRAAVRTSTIKDRCPLIRGDVTAIPCRDGSFGACRIDRVLQHIPEPDLAVRELARVLQPGGTLVAFDNDWDTFRIHLDDQEIALRIRRFWRDSFASGRIGRVLPDVFRYCGFAEIRAEPHTLTLTERSIAEQVFDIPVLLRRMVIAGILTPQESAMVQDEILQRSLDGTFSAGYTGFLVWGRKQA